MKTTFKSSEIAHVWAHKQAPYGKSPGAMSFRGDTFYSYSTAIARHIEHKGNPAIIINRRGFGPTTSKHLGNVRSALHDMDVPQFHFSEGYNARLEVTGNELFEYAIAEAMEAQGKASRARSQKGWHENEAAAWLESAKQINEFFGLRRKVDEKTIERLRESSEKARRESEKRIQLENEKRKLEQTEAFEAWKLGTIPDLEHAGSGYFNPSLFPVAFRVEGEELVSTKGARVPIADAKRALAFVLRHRESNWTKNGTVMPVGMYQLDSVTDGGVVAGCHRITWGEIERLQAIL